MTHPEPAFLDDEGTGADLPAFISTTHTQDRAEQAGKARLLTAGERAELRRDMAEASAWMRAELARRRSMNK